MKSKDQTLLEEAYTSINKVITEEETPMTPTKAEQPTGSNVVYVLVLEVDYEGETVYGIYTSPEAAEKALAEVESKSMHATSDANFVIKKAMLNSSPSNTCLE